MQLKSPKKLYQIEVLFANSMTRTVKVKASNREKAEARAMKFHPSAVGIKRGP